MNIYVASSWRNERQPEVVRRLREAGHEVYDFRNPQPGDNGFQWSEIDPDWQQWTPEQFRAALGHPVADRGFSHDMCGLLQCNACVLVLPCGRSAHLEAGWAAGMRKWLVILQDEGSEPELMYKMADRMVASIDELIETLRGMEGRGRDF